jgi:Domain of unknown function (DUF4279)
MSGSNRRRAYLSAHANLRIFGDDLDPSAVTRALELPPDDSWRKGDEHLTRSKSGNVLRQPPRKTGMWSMSSLKWVNSPKLENHILWLVSQLEPKQEQMQNLLAAGYKADIFCFSVGRTSQTPAISNQLRNRCASLGLSINIDHYQQDPSDERGHSCDTDKPETVE